MSVLVNDVTVLAGVIYLTEEQYLRCPTTGRVRFPGWYCWQRLDMERQHFRQPYDCEDRKPEADHNDWSRDYEPRSYSCELLYESALLVRLILDDY